MTEKERTLTERLIVLALKHTPSDHKDNHEIKELISEYFSDVFNEYCSTAYKDDNE